MEINKGLSEQYQNIYETAGKSKTPIFRYLASKHKEAFPGLGSRLWYKTCQCAKSLFGKSDYQLYKKDIKNIFIHDGISDISPKEREKCAKAIIKANMISNNYFFEHPDADETDQLDLLDKFYEKSKLSDKQIQIISQFL